VTGTPASSRHGVAFWVALCAGGAVMAVATWGAFDALSRSAFGSWGAWLIGLDLLNDLLVLPLVALVCGGLARLPLGRCRGPVQAGLFATVMVVLVAAPGLTGTAEGAGNPTIQPLDYRTAVLTVLAVVWTISGLWAVVRVGRVGPGSEDGSPDR
jgi:hypothetical protein